MMFFYFLKIIFDISTLKRFKKYKSHLILTKKKLFFLKRKLNHVAKLFMWSRLWGPSGFFYSLPKRREVAENVSSECSYQVIIKRV